MLHVIHISRFKIGGGKEIRLLCLQQYRAYNIKEQESGQRFAFKIPGMAAEQETMGACSQLQSTNLFAIKSHISHHGDTGTVDRNISTSFLETMTST